MKVVVKECDRYISELNEDKVFYQYLIYAYTDDMTPLGCEQVIGENERDNVIKYYLSLMIQNGDIKPDEGATYEDVHFKFVDYVEYNDFVDAIKENKPTYNG
jgi:hypothetical protein